MKDNPVLNLRKSTSTIRFKLYMLWPFENIFNKRNIKMKILTLCKYSLSGRFFLFIFILNLISNYAYLKYDISFFAIACIFFLSAFVAFAENIIFLLLPKTFLKKVFAISLFVLYNLLIVSDYFMIINFQTVLGQEAADILSETNIDEINSFLETYISPGLLIVYISIIIGLNIFAYFAAKLLEKFHVPYFIIASVICGILVFLFCFYNYVHYGNGMSIPQYTSITRSGYALYVMKGRGKQIRQLQKVCETLVVNQERDDKPTVIVIIGESFSVYHSSLMGYGKQTNPLLTKHKENGVLFLFDNVVSVHDYTHGALQAAFSLDSLGVNYASQALFPACFKAANYSTLMYDNEYLVGSSITFLSDKELSEAMFDYRNKNKYKYDGLMADDLHISDSLAFYVIHLIGQHYAYSQRFPKEFSRFNANEYDKKYTEHQRQMMADYDNATLYNDYVVDKILKKFEEKYCCVFYFSDHGEEIYELRDFVGHGNAEQSPNLNYQIRVPLMVWLSPSFYANNKTLVDALQKATHYPICTDDIGHTIIDVAGIRTKDFAPSRSFVNRDFNKNRHRIIMNHIDYDQEWITRR